MSESQPTTGAAPEAPKKRLMADLLPRIASAIVMIVLAIGALIWGGKPFALFWLAAGLAVHWEWQRMAGTDRNRLVFAGGSLALVLAAAFASQSGPDIGMAIIFVASAGLAWLAGPSKRLWASCGLIYAGALVGSVYALRDLDNPLQSAGLHSFGLTAIAWLFAVVWGTDIMAYFGGRLIGGPKLWPRVSPSKTWSGTLTGVICGGLLGLLLVKWLPPSAEPVAKWPILILGIVTAIISQAGDFLESSIKRHFGVKDSSNLIPGHGGFMDRLDGFITAAAFAALVCLVRGMPPFPAGLFVW